MKWIVVIIAFGNFAMQFVKFVFGIVLRTLKQGKRQIQREIGEGGNAHFIIVFFPYHLMCYDVI